MGHLAAKVTEFKGPEKRYLDSMARSVAGSRFARSKNMTYQNYIDTEDLSNKGFSETEVTLLNEAKELFLDNNFTQKMFDDYGRFQQALRNGYEGLK